MASRYRWRQQLLGSLQGQLQLATYLVVFLVFTGASSVVLLIGQRVSSGSQKLNEPVNSGHLITTTLTLSTFLTTLNASKELFTPIPMKDLFLTSNAQLVDKP